MKRNLMLITLLLSIASGAGLVACNKGNSGVNQPSPVPPPPPPPPTYCQPGQVCNGGMPGGPGINMFQGVVGVLGNSSFTQFNLVSQTPGQNGQNYNGQVVLDGIVRVTPGICNFLQPGDYRLTGTANLQSGTGLTFVTAQGLQMQGPGMSATVRLNGRIYAGSAQQSPIPSPYFYQGTFDVAGAGNCGLTAL